MLVFRQFSCSLAVVLLSVRLLWGQEAHNPGGNVSDQQQYEANVYQRLQTLESELRQLRQQQTASNSVQPAAHLTEQPCSDCVEPDGGCSDCQCLDDPCCSNPFPTFKVTGFFQLDAGFYRQDEVNVATLGDIEDGVGFRRARLAAAGEVSENTSYLMEFDFAQAQARFVDVWMQFDQTPVGNIRIGRFRQPFGMTELTSVRELPFLERPTSFALAPFRQTGIMLFDTVMDHRMTYAISGYRYLSDNFGNVYSDTGGYGAAGRLTGLLVDQGDESIVHLGADYSYNDPGRGQVLMVSTNEFFVSQNPALGLASLSVLPIIGVPPFVNTGLMPTTQTNLFNVEGAVSLGRALFQSEARWANVELTDGTENTFTSLYGHLRYMITGETIPYNRDSGTFGRIKPDCPADFWCGDYGAWEFAARVSYIDLNGTNLPGPGRRLTNVTLGLNWYLNDRTKFQFNWIHSSLDDPTLGESIADTYAVRGQIDF